MFGGNTGDAERIRIYHRKVRMRKFGPIIMDTGWGKGRLFLEGVFDRFLDGKLLRYNRAAHDEHAFFNVIKASAIPKSLNLFAVTFARE